MLLLHPGGLGDVILSLPAVARIRSRWPSAELTFAGNIDHVSPVMSGYVDHVISLSALPLNRLYASGKLEEKDIDFWRSFDRLVSWTGSGSSEFVRTLKAIHPNARIAAWKPQPEESRHVSQIFVDSVGIEDSPKRRAEPAYIRLDSKAVDEGSRWLAERDYDGSGLLAAIHPGAGSPQKRWPLERFIHVARELLCRDKSQLLIVEGPAESGLARQITGELPVGRAIPAESVPPSILGAVLKHCGLFVGSDSGIAHLAAALRVPSVVLFGPTLPRYWAPLGPHVVTLRDSYGCKGCDSEGRSHTCLNNIAVGDVLRNVDNALLC